MSNEGAVPPGQSASWLVDSERESDTAQSYRERWPNIGQWLRMRTAQICSASTLKRRIPILSWLPQYRLDLLPYDIIAGVTVTLTAIPQSIAYGLLANLTPQDGIYSNMVGCLMYAIFGSVKNVTIAPTSIMAIMVQATVSELGHGAALLAFLAGTVTLLFGLLNLGVLVRFISFPVITGFTTAACLTIGSAQLRSLLGIVSKGKGSDFLSSWETVVQHLHEVRPWDSVLGVSSIAFLILFRQTRNLGRSDHGRTFFKYLSLLRNALVVIVGATLAYILTTATSKPFLLTGHVEPGLPPFRPPPFSYTNPNGTVYGFGDMVSVMRASIVTIPLVSTLEIISIGKAFSGGKMTDATQEMLALGICNVAISFVSAIPSAGSFTRTAINFSSGVRTQLGCAVTALLLLLSLAVLTDALYYIPKATLASVVITAMLYMVDYGGIAEIWRVKKLDLLPFLATLLSCVFWEMDYGILVGVAVNCCFLLYLMSVPAVKPEAYAIRDVQVLLVHVSQSLAFSSAEGLRDWMGKRLNDGIELVVIDGSNVNFLDSTVVRTMANIEADLRSRSVGLLFWQFPSAVAHTMVRLRPELFLPLLCTEPDLSDAVERWKAAKNKVA